MSEEFFKTILVRCNHSGIPFGDRGQACNQYRDGKLRCAQRLTCVQPECQLRSLGLTVPRNASHYKSREEFNTHSLKYQKLMSEEVFFYFVVG